MSTTTRVVPYQSCVSCFKGDTTTVVMVSGSPEFHAAALVSLASLTIAEAIGTVQVAAAEMGDDLSTQYTRGFRLCQECARKTGATVTDEAALKAGEGFGYVQPHDDQEHTRHAE